MITAIDRAKDDLADWIRQHPRLVVYDDSDSTLLDVASGKKVVLLWKEFEWVDEKTHPETGRPYLILSFKDEKRIALVDPGGVAFSTPEINTEPLRYLPPVVCLRDYYTVQERIDSYLIGQRDEPPTAECVALVMVCIAILEGARFVGFDVSDMEQQVETYLHELERRIYVA
jgi:hypothetical protein